MGENGVFNYGEPRDKELDELEAARDYASGRLGGSENVSKLDDEIKAHKDKKDPDWVKNQYYTKKDEQAG